ncbi:hypothetical protein [Sulfurimonas sp. HSL3-2]|uniref:hypothetical protein n=1 Tax=Hydrocurvibacter mobilis TaxID=3131936 RepID=UPI0031FA2A21
MNILLAMDCDDVEEAKLCKINDVVKWAMLVVEEGQVVEILFADKREDFEPIAETVVVCDDNEYVWPFIEEQMQVLVAHTQRYIDDIVEAYLFKELHDLAY